MITDTQQFFMDIECYPRDAGACRFRVSGDTGDKCYAYVVVLHEGVLSAYDCVTVNQATKPRIRDRQHSPLRREESWASE
jgi:hypothetical protein